jgi:hypothetical protein
MRHAGKNFFQDHKMKKILKTNSCDHWPPECITQGSKSEMVEELKALTGITACAKLDEERGSSFAIRCPSV